MGTPSKRENTGRTRRGGRAGMPEDQTVRDVMTPEPASLHASASVLDAAKLMRDNDIGNVVVLEEERVCGILTDRDIVVRVLREGTDPAGVAIGDICSRELTTISPTASLDDAVRLIREKAIRRLPVVGQAGEVVGIVTIGDLALTRDPNSALADISAAPPNS